MVQLLGFLGCCSLSLWWIASASYSFYSPVEYFGTAASHHGMSYPHQGLAITNNNGIVIGGWTGNSNYWSSTYENTHTAIGMLVSTPGLTSTSTEDIEAVDENGALSEASYTKGVAYSSSNSLIVLAGYTKGTMKQSAGSSFNGDANTCEWSDCTTDAWVAVFNTGGVYQWGRQYSSGRPSQYQNIDFNVDMFTAVAVNSDQIWATGHTTNTISSSDTNQGSYDIIRVALYTSGSEINTFQEGSTGDDRAWGIVFNGNSEHFVGGETEGNWDNNNAGDWDILLIKYGQSGLKDWAIVYGGSASDEFAAMQISSAGDIYICGNTKGYLASSHAGGTYDYFLAKFSGSNGANEWTVQRGTSYSEQVHGFWIASTGNFLLAGTIENTSPTGATMDGQSGFGYDDAFLVELEASNSGAPTHKSTQLHGHGSYDDIGRGVVQVGSGNIYLIGEVRDTFVHDTYNQGLDIFVQLITTTTTTETTSSVTQTTLSSTSLTSSSSTATSVTVTTSTSSSITLTSSSSSSSTTSSTTTVSNTTTTTETTTSSTFSKTSSTSSTQTNTTSTVTTQTRTTTTSLSTSQTTTSSSATSTLSSTSTLTSSSSKSSTTSGTTSSTISSTTSITGTASSTTSSTTSISSTVSSTTSISSTTSATGSSTTSLTSLTWSVTSTLVLPADQTSQINSGSSNPGVTTVATTTTAAAVLCSTLPSGPGVLADDCAGKIAGESCQVLCAAGFEGGPTQYTCNAAGVFDGPSTPCQQPTCPVDQLPSNLDTTCGNTPFGGFCFVRCPQGFAFAEAIYTCETTGTFTGTPPTCNPLRCSSDGLPQDYRLNISSCIGATAGESCQVTCKYGFESTIVVPASNFQCANDGNFLALASVPSCSPKKCSAPTPATSFAVAPWVTDCEGVSHGQTCMALCTAGHVGSPAQFLCENGEILGVEPSCVPLPCQFTGEVLVGVDTSPCSGTTTGSSCQRQCIFGYEGLGDPSMTCQSDGSFSYSQFQCQPTSCGKLSDTSPFNEAEFKDSCQALNFGQSCSVLCETGWEMQGDAANMLCNSTPAHSAGYGSNGLPAANSTPPTCVGKTCAARLPNIRGATHDCENKTTLETCTVDAAVGFTSNGAATLQCGTDGEFKGTFPVITPAVCPTPTFGAGVASTCADKTIGAECWAYCLAGYTGSPQAYLCTADVSGAQVMPVSASISCSARRLSLIEASKPRRLGAGCGTAEATALGLTVEFEHSCSAILDTEICISHCSFGWALNGDASILTCQDGTLTGSLPSCTPVACTYNLPSALGMAHNCTDVTTGSSCFATCGAPGYTYSGSPTPEVFECLATGEFQGQNPTCAPLSCQNLTLSSEFEHNCRGMVFQDACAVSCAEGYTITGAASQYICGDSGTIQGTLPSCTPNPCTNTISAEIFQTSGCNGVTTGQSCSVSCQPGMIPNSADMTCHSSGSLVGALPSCLPAQCPTNSALEAPSVAHNCQNASFGQSCSVYCAAGYKLTQGAGQLWQCDLTTGSLALTGSLPSCEDSSDHNLHQSSEWFPHGDDPKALTCSIELNPSDSMTDNCSAELEVGDSCIQSCRKGYFQNGSAAESIICNLDLSVDGGSRPNCESVMCDTSQLSVLFPSFQHSCAGVTANRSCFAFCRAGYVAEEGVVQWTCTESASTDNVSQPVDGFALHGEIPNCMAQACIYNMPTGEGLSHDCENVSTDQTCVVSCAAGWSGKSETYTCGSDRVLTGPSVSCTVIETTSSMSTTTTTTLTLFLTGVITLEPRQEPPLALDYADLLETFTTDPNVTQAVATAVASVLNVSIDAVELNMTIANITIASDARRLLDMKEVVLVEYACSRSFPSLALASDWAATTVTLEEVKTAINENLAASSNVRAEVLDFSLQLIGLPTSGSEEEPGLHWVLIVVACCLVCCILLVAGLFFVKVCLPSKASQPSQGEAAGADEIDPEDPNVLKDEAQDKAETQADAVEVQAASVPDEDLELEAMLQEVGVEFYELSPEETNDGAAPSNSPVLELDGLRFLN